MNKSRRPGMAPLYLFLWCLLCLGLSACNTVTLASDSEVGLPLRPLEKDGPVRVLYVGNLCAGCADAHLEQMAAGMKPPLVIEVDSVVIPKY